MELCCLQYLRKRKRYNVPTERRRSLCMLFRSLRSDAAKPYLRAMEETSRSFHCMDCPIFFLLCRNLCIAYKKCRFPTKRNPESISRYAGGVHQRSNSGLRSAAYQLLSMRILPAHAIDTVIISTTSKARESAVGKFIKPCFCGFRTIRATAIYCGI